MARWYVASNITPADDNSLQAMPNPGAYTDLDDGDKALVMILNTLTTYTYDSSSSATESLPQVITPDGNAGNGRWILSKLAASGQNGFDIEIGPQPDSLATLGVSGTTFTLTHVADYDFYINGVVFRKTGNETVEITDVEGMHWIYFDSEGTIQIQAPGGTIDDIILYNCLIASVYWDATNNTALMLFDERHGTSMSPATHYHMHETIGASYDTGLALSGFDTGGNGTAATHAQFDLGTGTFHDEDNEHTIDADADATIDTYYRLGVGGPWRKITATAGYPVCDPQTGTRMDWNDYNGGTWQLAEVTNNQFVLTHYFATNDVLGGGVIGIMGQAEYTNIVQARTGADTELNALLIGDLPVEEILPIATVIWKTTNASTNQVAGAIYSVSGGGDYIDWRSSDRTGVAASVSDHESLSGLQGGASGDHMHMTLVQHTDLTDGGDTTLHDHDGISENTTHRTGDGSDHADVAANTALAHTQDTDTKIIVGDTEVAITDTGADGTITIKADNNTEVDITDAGMRLGGANSRVSAILDEDDMASDSATSIATQQSIKAYVRDNAGDAAVPRIDFYQDWLQETKYLNSTVVTMTVENTLVSAHDMTYNIENKRYDFTVGEYITSTDLYDSDLSLTDIEEAIADLEVTDSGSGTFQISNDGGSTWITITDTSQVVEFVTSDIDLRLKYTAGGTGYITHMGVLYNPDTIYAPATEVVVPGDNILINGDFEIAQRGTSVAAATNGTFVVDRFTYAKVGTAVHTVSQNTSPGLTVAESGHNSNFSLKADCTTADAAVAASDFTGFQYKVEGYDFSNLIDSYGTLSFWVKSTKTGTFSVTFRNNAGTYSYISEYTISASDTWEKQTFTVLFNEPSGVWEETNSDGVRIFFPISCGSTYTSSTLDQWTAGVKLASSNQVNATDSTDNNFELAQVKLEKGQVATPWKSRPFAEELALCKRYFERFYNVDGTNVVLGSSFNTSTTEVQAVLSYTEKRGYPTVSRSATVGDFRSVDTNGTHTLSALTFSTPTEKAVVCVGTSSSLIDSAPGYMYINVAAAYVDVDAEL